MTDLTGHTIGRYQILEPLGSGGMAIVYKAYDTRLDTEVAVKVIRTENIQPIVLERSLKRFEREAKSLARLTHPNIVKVTDYGEYQGKPFLVMEYLPGGMLKERLQLGTFSWQDSVRLLLPITHALEYAHNQNLIHRDVKSSNIMLTETGQPMLTDFGVAKIFDAEDAQELTGTGMGIGTPEYMAPEQWAGHVSVRSDIYSLGVVLYEMVTGRKPYTADTPAALLLTQATEPLAPPRQFVPDLPDMVEKLILMALAKNENDRYQSMKEFGAALELCLKIEGERRRKSSNQNSIQNPNRKKLKISSIPTRAIGSILVIILIGILFLSFRGAKTADSSPTISTHTATVISPFTNIPNTPKPTSTTAVEAIATAAWEIGSSWTRPADEMSMMYIPAGDFQMGSADGDETERPVHTVYLDRYWIDQIEVTNFMYAEFLNDNKTKLDGLAPWLEIISGDVMITLYGDGSWHANTGFEDRPVVDVYWEGARAYCEWAGGRLPTEAEWEKAARGGLAGMKYPWGDDLPVCIPGAINGAQVGYCNSGVVGSKTFAPNGYGLYNMAGNVSEWVADYYDPQYYSSSPSENPQGPTTGDIHHVLRDENWQGGHGVRAYVGGSFTFPGIVALRGGGGYGTDYGVGFRCAQSINPNE